MIEIKAALDADQAAITAAMIEERDKILARVASIARRVSAGDIYEQSAFLTTRAMFGPKVINLHTWNVSYGGAIMDPDYPAGYSGSMQVSTRPGPPRPCRHQGTTDHRA